MHRRSVTAAVVFALGQNAFAADAPQVALSVPPAFATEATVKHYDKGQDLLHDPIFHLITVAPLTTYHGFFGPRVARQADVHSWTVYVFAHYSPKVAAACVAAKDDLSVVITLSHLTNCWSQPLAVVKSIFDCMKQFLVFAALAVASAGSAFSR